MLPRRSFSNLRLLSNRLLNKELISPKLIGCAILTGVITGVICALFESIPVWCNAERYIFLNALNNPFIKLVFAFGISFLLGAFAIFLTKKFAPEAGGSGIPEIEGALMNLRPVRFKNVLPVKFFGGMCALSSGMVLGREGPSIQLGGNLGAAVAKVFKLSELEFHALLAAGGAAGLASAFNAPLAGILFVLEELRPQFKFNFQSIQCVAISVILATVARDTVIDTTPVLTSPNFANTDLHDLWVFLLFGVVVGVIGVFFNKSIGVMQDVYAKIIGSSILRAVLIVGSVAGIYGILSIYLPCAYAANSGMHLIPEWIITNSTTSLGFLAILLLARFIGILLCFCSGIPGGIFAPSLSLGALLGSVTGLFLLQNGLINYDPGILTIVGMGTFLAATVRSPITAIILVCEMTNNFAFILPMMISVLVASNVSGILGAKPLYSQILERTLKLATQKQAKN